MSEASLRVGDICRFLEDCNNQYILESKRTTSPLDTDPSWVVVSNI
jgi:hypothetical protein